MRLWKRRSSQSVAFDAFGVQVKVALDDIELRRRVQKFLPPGWAPCEVPEAAGHFGLHEVDTESYEVTVNGVPQLEHAKLDVALGMLDAQIRLFVAANARERIFVHAGVVVRDGVALVIPGESFSGKTTLVSALVELGATYYSDEYAVLDDDGRVHPYRRPFAIRGQERTATYERPVAELGRSAAADVAELAAVAVTRYRPGAEWRPKRVSSGHGVLALLANTVPAQERPAESLRAVSRAVAGALVLDGDRGEARPCAASLLEDLAARSG
jgi:hypothetical protein